MRKRYIILPLLVLILSACAFDISTTLYMQDVTDLVESQEILYINATFAIEFSGEEEDLQQAKDFLSEVLLEAQNFRQEERDYQTYLLADYKIPLIYVNTFEDIEAQADTQGNIFTIAILPEGSKLNAYITFNQSLFDDLNTKLSDQFYQTITLNEATIHVILSNDLREAIKITVFSTYANNIPVPYERTLSLERRDDIELKFSDVLRDSLGVSEETDPQSLRIRKFAEIVLQTQ